MNTSSFLRNRQLMNVLGAFIIGVVMTMFAPAVGYALAAGATVAIVFIYRNIKRAKARPERSEGTDKDGSKTNS